MTASDAFTGVGSPPPTETGTLKSFPERPISSDMEKFEKASSIDTSTGPHGPLSDLEPPTRFSLSMAGHLSLDDVAAVDIQIRDLAVTIDTAPSFLDSSTYPELLKQGLKTTPKIKTLLHSVAADLGPGTLTAIVGGSGSGKTTLLNTIAERMTSSRLAVTGSVAFNGQQGVHNVRHAYVMQQDVLLPTLTVRETLQYSADLRLPPSTTREQRHQVVEDVIRELGLKECADTRIGSTQHRGCSGGEKRRTSIGVQLLSNPSVLFLDEPTTGLDATSAYQLIRTLKSLARKGRTIVTTIHQPRSEIWDLFDNLIILTKGSPVYSGSMATCLSWFESLGFKLPPFVNPAEFLIDIAAVDNRSPELEAESTDRVNRLKAAWAEESKPRLSPPSSHAQPGESIPGNHVSKLRLSSAHAPFLRQVRVLTDRTFKVTYRDPMGMLASILEAVLMGLTTGYIFFRLGSDQSGIRSREGAMYTAAGLQGYLMLMFEVYRLTIDIPTFDREHSEGCVDVIPFLLSRRLARLFTEDLPVPFLFSVIFYFMTGLDSTPSKFFVFFAITLISQCIAMTCAMVCVSMSRHFPGASLIANLIFTLQSMACGMFIQANTIPIYVRWLKYITYTYFLFGAYCGNEFEGNFYDCPIPNGRDDPACNMYTGEYIMQSLGFPPNWTVRPIIISFSFVVFFSVLAALLLTFLRVEMTIARARTPGTDLSAGKEKMKARSIAEVRTIDVGLRDFALRLDKRNALGRKLPTKTILHPVNTTFQAGTVNVIMGPSGSGKTSLLNAMALRLQNTVGTRYHPSGKLTFNDAVPSESVIRSICSYVCQDDDALLPSLTVRETLRFAAGLRLPSWMSRDEKNKRAEEVLLKMGLKDCANNLIGSDLIKGISGGEKRRVTIAVQVLTDPRILLLDEPTSGLDAFTASSIMEVLQGLAAEGRTLILTIHQARSDLFHHFGNVLLLARGGAPVYAGAAKDMLSYFTRHGFECPSHTNPADYALDLITIDLQEAGREAQSRERVKVLVDAWQRSLEPWVSLEKPEEKQVSESRLSDIAEIDEKGPPHPEDIIPDGHEIRDITGEEKEQQQQQQTVPAVLISPAEQPTPAAHDGAAMVSLSKVQSPVPPPRHSFNKAMLATPAELGALVTKRASFLTAFPLLMQRASINLARQPPLVVARTMQVISLALILALFFAPLHNDYYSVQNRMGLIQEVGAFYFVGMLQNVAVYPAERDVFYREDDDRVYGVEVFLATYTLLELPFEIFSCLVFGILTDFAIGLPRSVTMYFVTTFSCFGIISCGESVGIMFNTLFNHTGFAVNLTSVFLSIANTMAGIFSTDMPPLLRALNYLSPIRYATRAIAPYSLRSVTFTCDETQRLPNGECFISTGQQVLELYNLDVDPVANVASLAACIVIYRLLAWLLLRIVRTRFNRRKAEEKS